MGLYGSAKSRVKGNAGILPPMGTGERAEFGKTKAEPKCRIGKCAGIKYWRCSPVPLVAPGGTVFMRYATLVFEWTT